MDYEDNKDGSVVETDAIEDLDIDTEVVAKYLNELEVGCLYNTEDDDEVVNNHDENLMDKQEPYNLYQLLDQIPNGRKTMNSLFYTTFNVGKEFNNIHFSNFQMSKKVEQYAVEWYIEEKNGLQSGTTTSLVDNDTPIKFSWSSTNTIPKNSVMYKHLTKSTRELTHETTNQKLMKIVDSKLDNIKKEVMGWKIYDKPDPLTKNNELDEKCDETEDVEADYSVEYNSDISNSYSIDRSKPSEFSVSSFKVDPLQEFVVTTLPKERKKKVKPVKKKQGLFWLFSGSKKKDKNKTVTKGDTDDTTKTNITNRDANDESMNQRRILSNNLNTDSTVAFVGQHQERLNSIDNKIVYQADSEKDIITESSIRPDLNKTDQDVENIQNKTVNNVDVLELEEVNKAVSNGGKTYQHQDQGQGTLGHGVTVDSHSHSHSESDNDFGDFAAAVIPITLPPKAPNNDSNLSPGHNDSSISLMNTFVPLQPKKKT
ncbi:hypothetical protein TPHA_0D02680 [Tetrapisispora phaffii CBS 4417]|uniref:Uncharacterized protein n=1 Tax=Tetrapisispora phaffii (strain ATCC 24235 / CBS 4417 / NBRC 1672 / NRRL Y-8282 / UCD 70-5) TaxID=1071381 RepID=G8BST4_TETPH|nr:hypothetical protein TPHA_0D02680 [Tetrapisispora phaffii CBS 4417]CCE62905.1 hypothetical protein TPHA_0D02680 [Tetrapisispora phaffii CBS 4417]